MGFASRIESFVGWPVADLDSEVFRSAPKKRFVPRLAVEDMSDSFLPVLQALLARPETATVPALVFGSWDQEMYSLGPASLVDTLVAARDRLPALRHLFVGDITGDECMISTLYQTDYGPLLAAFERLETLRIRGSDGLAFGEPFRHPSLRTLIVETGGLPESVIDAVARAELPALEHLELWLGTGWYSGISDVVPVRRLLAGLDRFPRLRHLGLRNAELADDVARTVVEASVLDRLRVLDLSLGTLSDAGAEALLSSMVRRLERLDLHHHYLSDAMGDRLRQLGIAVDVSEQCEAEVDFQDSARVYRYTAVSE